MSNLLNDEKNKNDYNPASFQTQEAPQHHEQVDPTAGPRQASTLSALFGNLTGNLVVNESHALATINPVVADIAKVRGIDVVTLSSKEHPGILADYIVPTVVVDGMHYIRPLLLSRTVTVTLGMYEEAVGPVKVMMPRKPADIMDTDSVQDAIYQAYAAKARIARANVGQLGEGYLEDDFTAMQPEVLRKTLENYILTSVSDMRFIFREISYPLISRANLLNMGYNPELKITSAKGDLYRPTTVGGQVIPAHAVVEVRAEKSGTNPESNRNGRTDIFASGGGESYVAATGAIVLDLVYTGQVPPERGEQPKPHVLSPVIAITATNFGESRRYTAGIVSKFLAVAGAMIYARDNQSTWFNLAVDQHQRYEQSGKGVGKGILANWQTIPWASGLSKEIIKFDATKSGGKEMAEVLLDPQLGFIKSEPVFALDLSRGSDSGAVDFILLEAFNNNAAAINQVLAALDAVTDNRFSNALGNNPIFVQKYDRVIPDGEGNFGGEIRNLREITLPAVATRAYAAGDAAVVENWLNYQVSTTSNSSSSLASVYDQVYASMGTNVKITSMYHRLILSSAMIRALEESLFGASNALSLRDMANLPAWGNTSYSNRAGMDVQGVSSRTINHGGYTGASNGYGLGRNRFGGGRFNQ